MSESIRREWEQLERNAAKAAQPHHRYRVREARLLHLIADAINRAFNERDDLKNLPGILLARAATLLRDESIACRDTEGREMMTIPNAAAAASPSVTQENQSPTFPTAQPRERA